MGSIRYERSIKDYADMLDMPAPEPTTRPRMAMIDRAAQFSPYAALVGFGDIVEETARLTDNEMILDENQTEVLDQKLQLIQEDLESGHNPTVEVSYFVPDARKKGGSYQIKVGRVKRIDPVAGVVIFMDKKEISIRKINEVYGELFSGLQGE